MEEHKQASSGTMVATGSRAVYVTRDGTTGTLVPMHDAQAADALRRVEIEARRYILGYFRDNVGSVEVGEYDLVFCCHRSIP